MNIEDIKQIMDAFDPAALLPDLTTMTGKMELICRICVMAGPVLLLALGLMYLFLAPKEANHHFGYRCYYGMGSVEAWQFTQKAAGLLWSVLGGVLSIVMIIATTGLRNLNIVDQVWRAVKCLGWEIGLIALSVIAINTLAGLMFDKNGDRRPNAPDLARKLQELKKKLKKEA